MTGIGAPPSLPRLTAKIASQALQWPLAIGSVTIGPAAIVDGDVLVENVAADVATERGIAVVQISSASPYGNAHVQFQSGFGFSTRLLSEWVRDKKVMSLEQAVRRLTFDPASIFGLYDRGLVRPGRAADIVIFDPDTVKPLPLEVLHDFPTGAKRIKEPAQGIMATVVNGQVLMEDGKHTSALPGRVRRNTYYHASHT